MVNPTPGFDNSPIATQSGGSFWASTTSDASTTQTDPLIPPTAFVNMASSIISGRIGVQAYLIPQAQMNALILKMWQSPAVQYNWSQYRLDPTTWAPAVAQQVQNEILNPTLDPSITVDYANLKLAAGRGLSLNEQTALAQINQAQGALVPRPFDTSTVSGYDYGTPMPKGGWTGTGQSFGWDKHYGVDYGTAAGSRIVAPFAGTIEVKTGLGGYGNLVMLHLDDGWTLSFGHVGQGFGNGTRVNPGDLIALSGQNVGSAKGAVTIVMWQDPTAKMINGVLQGGWHNPHEVLDPVFKGITFGQIKDIPNSYAGTGMPSVNTLLDQKYPSIKNDWVTYFGSPPSPQDVQNVLNHGSSPAQWTDYIRSLPSHIGGMTTGSAFDLRNVADQISTKMYGHLSTDGIVSELHSQGLTKPNEVEYYYDMMPGKDLDKSVYNGLFHANTQYTFNIHNEKGADPRVIAAQASQLGSPAGPGLTK